MCGRLYLPMFLLRVVLPFGNIYHLTFTNSVSTDWPSCVPTYYPHVGQNVLIFAIHLFDHLELFCRNKIRNINVLEVFLCFFNKDTSLLVHKLVLNLPLVILNGYNACI